MKKVLLVISIIVLSFLALWCGKNDLKEVPKDEMITFGTAEIK
jgi:hypothetical protein